MSIKGTSGDQRFTADGAVGVAGRPCRVWNATWLSDGTARNLVLRNGATVSGDVVVQQAGLASLTVTLNFAGGKLFPAGCFVDFTASTTSVNIEFELEK